MSLSCLEIGINAPKVVPLISFCLLGTMGFWEIDPFLINDHDVIKLDYSSLTNQEFFYDVSYGDIFVNCNLTETMSRDVVACIQEAEKWSL